MKSEEVRQKCLEFFEGRGHAIVPSSSLVPENDPSVLFTTAGMQQFKPYYLGEKSPYGDKVVSIQKCLRTSDIDKVGDESHLTFFEMLGNFSFNNAYWKKEAIELAHEFITKELKLKIDHVSVFAGEDKIPADTESQKVWLSIDSRIKIVKAGKEDNFWGPTGEEGPCGPTTEIYIGGVEIWNIVFNEYYKDKEGRYSPLEHGGVDTGMGLERLLTVLQNKTSFYETDLFSFVPREFFRSSGRLASEAPPQAGQTKLAQPDTQKSSGDFARITADHVKAALFLLSDGVRPSNTGAGYVLRRLIRRAARFSPEPLGLIAEKIKSIYQGIYPIDDKGELEKEESKFRETLGKGMKEFEKGEHDPFILFSTYGFPPELAFEIAEEKGIKIDVADFEKKMKEHQEKSRTAVAGLFKGGLADHDPKTIRLHTAHHLLLAALQRILGPSVKQRGSNITQERLRLDFSFDRKLDEEERKKIENLVNDKIREGLTVVRKDMPKEEALKLGAEMEFGAKYGDVVSIYFIQDKNGNIFSKEFCGGPHVSSTAELAPPMAGERPFKIIKEEAVSAGVRRIRAVLHQK